MKETMTIVQRLERLRQAMQEEGLDAYLIPSNDPHQSEYVAAHWKSRHWISGFSGSAGTVVVTMNHAGLWTDSRYFIQAEQELKESGFVLQKQQIPHAPEHLDWLVSQLGSGSRIGLDGRLFTIGQIRAYERMFSARNIQLLTSVDLVKPIWEDRPAMPVDPVFELDASFAGHTRKEKLQAVREQMEEKGLSHYLLPALDDIAWVFNLRGVDVECNPVFYAYALLEKEAAHLFVAAEKVSSEIQLALQADGVQVHPYHAIEFFLEALPESSTIGYDQYLTQFQFWRSLEHLQCKENVAIIRQLKAIKNPVEVKHLREAMRRDGIALTRLYRWLEAVVRERTVTEVEVAEKLDSLRREQGDYHGESFAAIVGYKANGAIVHYHPEPGLCAEIHNEGILLLDSGGQYTYGTTDITRTTVFGIANPEQKRAFTLVLKGNIALSMAIFPVGTSGVQLDTLARQPLWQFQMNYGHGTGHGVGFFLNVHEPPQGFVASAANSRGTTPLEPGMLTSNEPGYYKTGEYGIRIENLILCVEAGQTESGRFLKFDTLTLFPIDQHLIDRTLLTPQEIDWLNAYHQEVFETLAPG
ncbi:MAG: aminopeptidase P family protein [Saprospirales bacterium]|nr:aminopeptidase P family protein [Saprospirales bacterium]